MPIQPMTVEQCVEEFYRVKSDLAIGEDFIRSVYASALRHAAEVLPGKYESEHTEHYDRGIDDCRAAILAEADKVEKV